METAEAHKAARDAGFTLFQGYFFCKPVTCKAGALPTRRLAYLQLLAALRKPDVGIREIEEAGEATTWRSASACSSA